LKALHDGKFPLAAFANSVTEDSLKYSPLPVIREVYEENVIVFDGGKAVARPGQTLKEGTVRT